MLKETQNKQNGFTLIELLVVIAIIGLISSILTVSFSVARMRGRDARRMADIRQMNSAIQMYIQENDHAPYVGTYNCNPKNADDNECYSISATEPSKWMQLQVDLSPFMPKLPVDPCGEQCNQNSQRRAVYVYMPPAGVKNACASCGEENYVLYAQMMEVSSNLLNITFAGFPTFGITSGFGNSF